MRKIYKPLFLLLAGFLQSGISGAQIKYLHSDTEGVKWEVMPEKDAVSDILLLSKVG